MASPFLIPIAIFAAVAILVGIGAMERIRDKEHQVGRDLGAAEDEHRRRMAELEQQLDRVGRGEAP
jgi:hypothetical protein